jgi:membrane-bound serine protease (ClpP class)
LNPIYISPAFVAVIIILVVAFIIFAAIWSVRAHRRKVAAGKEDLIGSMAVVETTLNPRGTVFIEGEIWNAVINEGRADPQEEVMITAVKGLKLEVTKTNKGGI